MRSGILGRLGILAVCVVSLAATLSGCRDVGLSLGGSQAQARAQANDLLSSLGDRFGPVASAPGYDDLRVKLARSALVPSRLYDDPSVWTASTDATRRLEWGGRRASAGYVLGYRDGVRAPATPGEYRRTTSLRDLGSDEFEWTVRDELAIGEVSPAELSAALGVILRGAERGDAAAVRDAYRRSLPRTTRALARLFTLDSLTFTPAREGGTLVSITATSHPERIASALPYLSRYLERYMTPTRLELAASEAGGARWWTATLRRDRIDFRFRVQNGRLAPLAGPARAIPADLEIEIDLATRIRIFGVGFSDLVGNLHLQREPAAKGFSITFKREPDWNLPLLVERLVKAPLRRPFEGGGAVLAFTARQTGGRTSLVRDYRIAVHESAIVRWIGDLGSTAIGDFRAGAEREYDIFNGDMYEALRLDMADLLR